MQREQGWPCYPRLHARGAPDEEAKEDGERQPHAVVAGHAPPQDVVLHTPQARVIDCQRHGGQPGTLPAALFWETSGRRGAPSTWHQCTFQSSQYSWPPRLLEYCESKWSGWLPSLACCSLATTPSTSLHRPRLRSQAPGLSWSAPGLRQQKMQGKGRPGRCVSQEPRIVLLGVCACHSRTGGMPRQLAPTCTGRCRGTLQQSRCRCGFLSPCWTPAQSSLGPVRCRAAAHSAAEPCARVPLMVEPRASWRAGLTHKHTPHVLHTPPASRWQG